MVVIGVITSPHGVRGQFKVKAFTSVEADVTAYGPVQLPDGRSLTLKRVGQAKNLVICRADEVSSREQAEALRGLEISVSRDQLPAAAEDELYQADLIGLVALAPDGAEIGQIIGFYNFGAGELVEIKPADATSFFTPFGAPHLIGVDQAAGHITLSIPAGLLDDGADGDDQEEADSEEG